MSHVLSSFLSGKVSIGTLITPIYTPFYVKSPEGNPSCFCKKAFLGFFPEPFPGAIATAALIIATAIIITTAITTTAIGGTPIKVKALPFKETFQKVSSITSLLYYLFYDNINIFLIRESDRSYGLTASGPLYFLFGVLI